MGLVEVYDGEVGSLARLYGSRLILDVEGFCSVDGDYLQEVLGGGASPHKGYPRAGLVVSWAA